MRTPSYTCTPGTRYNTKCLQQWGARPKRVCKYLSSYCSQQQSCYNTEAFAAKPDWSVSYPCILFLQSSRLSAITFLFLLMLRLVKIECDPPNRYLKILPLSWPQQTPVVVWRTATIARLQGLIAIGCASSMQITNAVAISRSGQWSALPWKATNKAPVWTHTLASVTAYILWSWGVYARVTLVAVSKDWCVTLELWIAWICRPPPWTSAS